MCMVAGLPMEKEPGPQSCADRDLAAQGNGYQTRVAGITHPLLYSW